MRYVLVTLGFLIAHIDNLKALAATPYLLGRQNCNKGKKKVVVKPPHEYFMTITPVSEVGR